MKLDLFLRRCGSAILLSSMATLAAITFRPLLLSSRSWLFLVTIAASAWTGRLTGGIVATLVCTIAFGYIFLEPTFSPSIASPQLVASLAEFALIGMLIAVPVARLRDIQDELAANLALLDTLTARAPVGLAYLDQGFHFLRLNQALADMIGVPVAANLGRSVREMLPRLWRSLEPLLAGVITTGTPVVNVEVSGETLAAPGQERSWLVSYYPVQVKPRETAGVGVVVVEITDQRHAEELRARLAQEEAVRAAVEAERARLAAILNRAPSGIVFVEAGTYRLLANPRASELFGRSLAPNEGPAQYVHQVRRADGRPLSLADLPSMRALKGETPPDQEHIIVRPDGSEVTVIESTAPVRSPGGAIQGSVVIMQDITSLKEFERVREEFMSAIAHELRTPLAVIRGRSELALLRGVRDDGVRQTFEIIIRQVDRMVQVVSDMLTAIRVRPGRQSLTFESVDLATLVEAVVRRSQDHDSEPRIDFQTRGPLPVDVDPSLIENVIRRLIENAGRYSPPGSPIEIHATSLEDYAVVSVTDHGVGIAPDRQPHVFEPFYELVPPGKPGYSGQVSLNLYLSKQIVEGNGGRIWFTSTPGEGSTFSFGLPLAQLPG